MHKKGKAPTGRTHPTAQKIFGVIVVIVLLITATMGKRGCNKKAEEKEAKAAAERASAPPTRHTVAAERPWTSRTFDDIPEHGLRLWLEQGSARYPKLGGVKTITSSGVVYVDLPGVDNDGMNNPAGWFTFFPDPPGSRRGIEIYNRW